VVGDKWRPFSTRSPVGFFFGLVIRSGLAVILWLIEEICDVIGNGSHKHLRGHGTGYESLESIGDENEQVGSAHLNAGGIIPVCAPWVRRMAISVAICVAAAMVS